MNQICENERWKTTSEKIIFVHIFKNVDITANTFQQQFLPVMKDLIRCDRRIQTFIIFTARSECGETPPIQDIAFLSFHPSDQHMFLFNESANYHTRHLLPESASFLGFFLRRKVIGLETSDMNR